MIYPVSENSPDLYIHVLVTTFERCVSANIDVHPSRYTERKKKKKKRREKKEGKPNSNFLAYVTEPLSVRLVKF